MKKNIILQVLIFVAGTTLFAQNNVNNVQLPELRKKHSRTIIHVPNPDGYITLKCDFHMHTVFSDGVVWPTIRVREAWEEGLDAIAISDHIENNPSKKYVGGDDNSSYEIALEAAKNYNLMLIKSGEITRDMPPGHFNALFLDDVNKLDVNKPVDAIMAAHEQDAFIIWNHPGWKAQQPDTCRRFDIHNDLIKKGVIGGIEVFNEKEWYPIALKWCIDDNLAVIGNSDIHDVNEHYYPLDKYHRPMTLVFAEERTIESIREAMNSRRTVAWFSKYVAGPENILAELYGKSVDYEILPEKDAKGRIMILVTNDSDFTFDFESHSSNQPGFTLYPHSADIIRVNTEDIKNGMLKYNLDNWYVNMHQPLLVEIKI
jgi:3',5'-nucleoside bisphosphate phosphatase